jgi:hypothetical protein
MSLAIIDDLANATAQLRAAMQAADLSDIEQAMARFRTALDAVQSVGAWRTDPALKARVGQLLGELESSRTLALLMSDLTGQMHASAAARQINAPQALYQPPR